MVEGFTKNHKFRPTGRNRNGVSEKEFENVSKDFIRVPHDHVFNKAIKEAEKQKKNLEKIEFPYGKAPEGIDQAYHDTMMRRSERLQRECKHDAGYAVVAGEKLCKKCGKFLGLA